MATVHTPDYLLRKRRRDQRRATGNATRDTIEQGERASAPGFDPTCAMCQDGSEPGHEH